MADFEYHADKREKVGVFKYINTSTQNKYARENNHMVSSTCD